jgi:hypothetical protein
MRYIHYQVYSTYALVMLSCTKTGMIFASRVQKICSKHFQWSGNFVQVIMKKIFIKFEIKPFIIYYFNKCAIFKRVQRHNKYNETK